MLIRSDLPYLLAFGATAIPIGIHAIGHGIERAKDAGGLGEF